MVGKTVAIIQSRLNSSRLPAKAMLNIAGKTLLERVARQVKKAVKVDEILVATSIADYDDIISEESEKLGVAVFRGDLHDVLNRFYQAAQFAEGDVIVRICADDPLIEPRFIDLAVETLLNNCADYVVIDQTPLGCSAEAFTFQALERACLESTEEDDREHVTLFMRKRKDKFKAIEEQNPYPALKRPDVRLTLDTIEDYYLFYHIFRRFSHTDCPSLEAVIQFLDDHPPHDYLEKDKVE